ncbi:hypothetical protein QS306_00820 [Paraburkholderia bonniea]|uniref:hypothetical protein n=1 Tax=Paraburkholderia bonniea TaxID=2152891 RepID=UPI001291A336|nr:hypothetical protein [Paraburkholderia bonniea]WJF90264.1 hypothetical protein QS306_00820 [Paraburkholderia bonniea]WJF93579.1 hypothetical protein QS308_00820 [Paraburkholderia bonniea]
MLRQSHASHPSKPCQTALELDQRCTLTNLDAQAHGLRAAPDIAIIGLDESSAVAGPVR